MIGPILYGHTTIPIIRGCQVPYHTVLHLLSYQNDRSRMIRSYYYSYHTRMIGPVWYSPITIPIIPKWQVPYHILFSRTVSERLLIKVYIEDTYNYTHICTVHTNTLTLPFQIQRQKKKNPIKKSLLSSIKKVIYVRFDKITFKLP